MKRSLEGIVRSAAPMPVCGPFRVELSGVWEFVGFCLKAIAIGLDDAPEIVEIAIEIIEDLYVRRRLGEEDVESSAEDLDVGAMLREVRYDPRGQKVFSPDVWDEVQLGHSGPFVVT